MAETEEEHAGPRATRRFSISADPSLLRHVSQKADGNVESAIGAKVSPPLAVIFILNSLTGLSLLTLPFGFAQTGLLLGALLLFVCMAFAYMTATFMCEALTIANALQYEDVVASVAREEGVLSRLHNSNPQGRHRRVTFQDEEDEEDEAEDGAENGGSDSEESGDSSEEGEEDEDDSEEEEEVNLAPMERQPVNTRTTVLVGRFKREMRIKNADHEFKIRERVELGPMGEQVLNKDGRSKIAANVIYVMVLSFTYGTACALVVTVNTSLAAVIGNVMGMLGKQTHEGVNDAYYKYCVIATFCISLPLCFANMQKTKNFMMVIMVLRFIAIFFLIVISSTRTFGRWNLEGFSGIARTIPLWNPGNFMSVFGNAVFLFGIHHYLPSMVSPLEPQKAAPRVIRKAFGCCYVLIILVCLTALTAWGGEPADVCSKHAGGNFCQVQPLYNLNFQPLDWAGGWLGLFIVAYPSMAISAIPIAAITTRNTMGRWLGLPPSNPDQPCTLSNMLLTLAVLVPPFGVALITRNVQAVIKYVGSYAGLTVAILCPLVLLIKSRDALDMYKGDDKYVKRPLKSPFGHRRYFRLIVVFYSVSFVLVSIQLFILN